MLRRSISRPAQRLLMTKSHLETPFYGKVVQGSKFTPEYAQYLKLPNGEVGSYFHDIPLELNRTDNTVNMVVEVARWSNAKFEISRTRPFNPMVQDNKNGKVRFIDNVFPAHGFIHNYGAIPQTWEDPTVPSTHEGVEGIKGDNDPLDCCEIGSAVLSMGDVKRVKILGSLAMIDQGELDWKILVIDTKDPLAPQVHNLNDVETHFPKVLESTRSWFRNYKIPTGKPANEFAFSGQYRGISETLSVIEECHESWRKLLRELEGNESVPQTKRAGAGVVYESQELPDAPIPPEIGKWHYIK
ncbi:LAME_0E01970g1_1 [Lachancea meyersii CBS 8951]|uniref:inorganic diphosphatase n=1 Tax=Lachancea meyersii CBS 8951 TaxID=1266667 RepID=A0A1G4JFI3_9SACH|nr:LAME_0E01970g1_1 [Lachancea meyersii CBS 8951]